MEPLDATSKKRIFVHPGDSLVDWVNLLNTTKKLVNMSDNQYSRDDDEILDELEDVYKKDQNDDDENADGDDNDDLRDSSEEEDDDEDEEEAARVSVKMH